MKPGIAIRKGDDNLWHVSEKLRGDYFALCDEAWRCWPMLLCDKAPPYPTCLWCVAHLDWGISRKARR